MLAAGHLRDLENRAPAAPGRCSRFTGRRRRAAPAAWASSGVGEGGRESHRWSGVGFSIAATACSERPRPASTNAPSACRWAWLRAGGARSSALQSRDSASSAHAGGRGLDGRPATTPAASRRSRAGHLACYPRRRANFRRQTAHRGTTPWRAVRRVHVAARAPASRVVEGCAGVHPGAAVPARPPAETERACGAASSIRGEQDPRLSAVLLDPMRLCRQGGRGTRSVEFLACLVFARGAAARPAARLPLVALPSFRRLRTVIGVVSAPGGFRLRLPSAFAEQPVYRSAAASSRDYK